MIKYILKRIFLSIFILLGVAIIIYGMMRMLPSDYIDNKYAAQVVNGTINEADIIRMKEIYGLSDNAFVGFMKWVGKAITGDLGFSFKYGIPVTQVIAENVGISFAIAVVALIFQFTIAIFLGIKAATNQYGPIDYSVSIFVMIGVSLPSFFFSAILIKVFAIDLGLFPMQGLVSGNINFDGNPVGALLDKLHHLILPIIVMVILSIGGLMRYTRTNTLEVLSADYIRTARAKGLSEKHVIYKHAFRNTMIPLATLMAGILPSLFGGAMIIEQVFAIPGIGQRAYLALSDGDIPFIMGYNLFLSVLTVIGTLFADIMYAIVDPRVKLV